MNPNIIWASFLELDCDSANRKTASLHISVEYFKKGKIEIKNDKFGNLQMSIGKVSFDWDSLLQNFDEVIAEVLKSKPASSKGEYIKSVYISSTMGPSIPVDINL